jgi:hypothetical protein
VFFFVIATLINDLAKFAHFIRQQSLLFLPAFNHTPPVLPGKKRLDLAGRMYEPWFYEYCADESFGRGQQQIDSI